MKIAVIHATQNSIQPLADAAALINHEVKIINFLDETLLYRVNEKGRIDSVSLRNFLKIAMRAAESKPDGMIIACSIYCPYVSWVRQICDCPVIAIDQPMITEAVALGSRIGVLATTAASGPSAVKKLEEEAEKQGKTISTETKLLPKAMTALVSGDVTGHDRLIKKGAEKLIEDGCDTIVLAQITMARAKYAMESLPVKVLSSPASGIRELLKLLDDGRKEGSLKS